MGYEKPGTDNTDGPKPSWWKAGAGIVFLVLIMGFGTLHNISQEKPEMFVSIVEPFAPFVEPVLVVLGVPLPVDLRRTLDQWKEVADEIEFRDLLQNANMHKGKHVYFQGVVHHVEKSPDQIDMIVKVAPSERGIQDGHVCLKYSDASINVREGDVVEFVAEMQGVWGVVEMPELSVRALEVQTQ